MIHLRLLSAAPEVGNEPMVAFVKKDKLNLPAFLSSDEGILVENQIEIGKTLIALYRSGTPYWIVVLSEDDDLEKMRSKGHELAKLTQKEKVKTLALNASNLSNKECYAFAEGYALSSYRFIKYFKDEEKNKKLFTVSQLDLFNEQMTNAEVLELNNMVKAIFWARDMVNEPVSVMNATRFAKEVAMRGQESGYQVETLDKEKIKALRMGGLLAVNQGSIDPPTFSICEWKPENASNKKPIVLVGKGVMYDTGGLSLKPTANSMDMMKSDMAGAAAIAASMYSIALNELPVWVIGLLPATDNRPGENAYTPGDVITMYNGLHVEVLNTDAEGRMILADALSYGDKYEPELVIDMATLTGSAEAAIGSQASVFMGNADQKWFENLQTAANQTHERLVQFPFWPEYNEQLKSDVADLKNLGGRTAGAITAGKFLEHFTQSPYIHIDIAGTGFITAAETYRPKGGTGVGVRLLTEFFKNISNQADKS